MLAQDCQFGLALLQPVLDIRFELLLPSDRFLQGEFVLTGVDRRQELVALDLQFGPAYLEVRLDDFHLVLALADFQFRFGLLEVLLDLLNSQQAVLERSDTF